MTAIISSTRCLYMLKWLDFDINKEYDRPNPSHIALCNMNMQKATIERCLEEALQKEASDATYLSFWTSNVTDHAALCGF